MSLLYGSVRYVRENFFVLTDPSRRRSFCVSFFAGVDDERGDTRILVGCNFYFGYILGGVQKILKVVGSQLITVLKKFI